jgi:Protein of unknown function (DUF1631)
MNTLINHELLNDLRSQVYTGICKCITEVSECVRLALIGKLDSTSVIDESLIIRDLWADYKFKGTMWQSLVESEYKSLLPDSGKKQTTTKNSVSKLELLDLQVLEIKILADSSSQPVKEHIHDELSDLILRLDHIERGKTNSNRDLFKPELLVRILVEQWVKAGMLLAGWLLISDAVERILILNLKSTFQSANELLKDKGVLPLIQLTDRFGKATIQKNNNIPLNIGSGKYFCDVVSSSKALRQPPLPGFAPVPTGNSLSGLISTPNEQNLLLHKRSKASFWRQNPGALFGIAGFHQSADAVDDFVPSTPQMRYRSRARTALNKIKFILFEGSETNSITEGIKYDLISPVSATKQVVALPHNTDLLCSTINGNLDINISSAEVKELALSLREKSLDIKAEAETKSEKATIEIVALMFQSILAEDRIPPEIRVWFARLQIPVIRLALSDKDFLVNAEHPARLLIDRMGSCVLGFDVIGVQRNAMTAEICRVVQIIEQYSDEGKKVFHIVHEEFKIFLSRYLSEKEYSQKIVGIAQKIEEKEILHIQYMIEMRKILQEMFVRNEIREFLFKVWSEVLAVSALHNGQKHPETRRLKNCVSDLLWAANAKQHPIDRKSVFKSLPNMLVCLRSGMSSIGLSLIDQDLHIKNINISLSYAFASRALVLPQAKIDAIALRLDQAHNFELDDNAVDFLMDSKALHIIESRELGVTIIDDGVSKPTTAVLDWARELEIGSWFNLDYKDQVTKVQLIWRSDKKKLNLLSSISGHTYLIRSIRLGAYLQEGLLSPLENEPLTVRASINALLEFENAKSALVSS